ncbi:GATA transcription factor 9-like [Tasmannia lanceolata]|uniref:GATA transcription factor 9-like n=1 Tax=Tasmannia lanceolata TaxID=3420 RepID=UPI004063DF97
MESPEFVEQTFSRAGTLQLSPEKSHADQKLGEHFIIDDLLDFSNEEAGIEDGIFDSGAGNSTESSTVTVVESCNSSFSGSEPQFSGDLGCRSFADAHLSGDLSVPYEDLAELEWLSNFVEESFSSDDLQKLHLISGMKPRIDSVTENKEFSGNNGRNNPIFRPEISVPGKARSKRSRAAPCDWSSRLLVLSPASSSESGISNSGKKEISGTGDGRKCLHCLTEKTPQWRTGPMGPKTLCNACGVRYKSGRLVPEYRPAASPTFMMTKHSNSHRKVLELRRKKELEQQHQFQHPNAVLIKDDYLNYRDDYLHLLEF